ncbi:MarR family winged helix-turn-helix transcriptional regulator [Bailinhaonella thermotolerans]|uniref:MarR family transcriptional regulator n=1 Tax=Bailinhaonella thermotolerans TaxID=1070861 RepID=A0A3A4BI92_9ACTN|nr:MarR family transcriptional regulator [Bailinhaonella thermotolerans]RJL30972.1 MarR family transcriptional regulator [Bailinhaonella thermotolerans]
MFETSVSYQLIRLLKAHRQRLAEDLAGLGLHVGQEMLLARLWERDGLSQSELVARLGVEPPTVTKTLQRLERAGFVRREPDPGNRRVSRVYLTERGRELRGPVERAWNRMDDAMLAGLDGPEREALRAMLPRMAAGIAAAPIDGPCGG